MGASGDMPAPVHAAQAESVTYELGPGHETVKALTNAITYDRQNNCVLFAGIEGKVGCINVLTGEQRTLLEVPGRPPISYMDLSHDGTALLLRFAPVHFERSSKTPWQMQFWRYPPNVDG